ncbi:MAG: IclR family transcriptional regulator [Geminicoccaceae bacterium]|nr:IclR family transcriptional regulator [Geminicoccaceae bacterium]
MRLLQSLTRGLAVLDYMISAREPVRLTDVAQVLGIDKSNAAHILKTLVAAGYAEQNGGRRYFPSRKVVAGRRGGHTLEEIVAVKEAWRGRLEDIVDMTGECAHLAVLVGARVWYIDKVDSALPLKVDHPVGSLAPLHCTALGKAFLAFGHARLPGQLPSFTVRTLTVEVELTDEIAATRRRGYAVDNEEFATGIRCVAGPIIDDNGYMVAAIGISGPSVRIDERRMRELGSIVTSIGRAGQEGGSDT